MDVSVVQLEEEIEEYVASVQLYSLFWQFDEVPFWWNPDVLLICPSGNRSSNYISAGVVVDLVQVTVVDIKGQHGEAIFLLFDDKHAWLLKI